MNFQTSWRTWRTFLKHTHHTRARYELPKESSRCSRCSSGSEAQRSQSRPEVPGNTVSWPSSMLAASSRLEWRTPASAPASLTTAHRTLASQERRDLARASRSSDRHRAAVRSRQLREPSLVGALHEETSAVSASHETNRPRAIVHACERVHIPRNSSARRSACRQESL